MSAFIKSIDHKTWKSIINGMTSEGDKYRSILGEEDEKNTVWRFGGPPNYDVVNKLFEEGRTKIWAPGSVEETVQNLVKSWEMEVFHKTRPEDMKTVLPDFTYSLNGRKALSLKEIKELGGGYNPHLQTSLPEHLRIYNPAMENFESSHRAFIETFPRGFALELIQLYCGPPEIVFKFRHWGFMEGPFKGHAPTGDIIELFGIAIMPVDEKMRIKKVEFFFDRGELLGKLVVGERIQKNVGHDETLKCPVLRNTG